MVFRLILLSVFLIGMAGPPLAQNLSGLARVQPSASSLADTSDGQGALLKLALTQAVPYRIFTLDAPRRLVLDFNEVDWSGFDTGPFNQSSHITGLRVGGFVPGWSRMVLDLAGPLSVELAGLDVANDGQALVRVTLTPTTQQAFAQTSGAPPAARDRVVDPPLALEHRRQDGQRPLIVVLDPGHGGIDPGAEADGIKEADLILTFALELRETLLRTGDFQVILTRDSDEFIPLETRISLARNAHADVFLSLHADALVQGRASGATIYTLSDEASDAASRKLAERHDRGDLLSGVDLSQQDDVIATVLMDMARIETTPRTQKLAQALVAGLSETVGMHKRPHLFAGFSVLKAADIPSALIEIGFLSSKRDRQRLLNKEWRAQAAIGIRNALQSWRQEDAADAAGRHK